MDNIKSFFMGGPLDKNIIEGQIAPYYEAMVNKKSLYNSGKSVEEINTELFHLGGSSLVEWYSQRYNSDTYIIKYKQVCFRNGADLIQIYIPENFQDSEIFSNLISSYFNKGGN